MADAGKIMRFFEAEPDVVILRWMMVGAPAILALIAIGATITLT